MICSSLCRVPFIAVLLSWVWENSHSRWSSFRGLGHELREISNLHCLESEGLAVGLVRLVVTDDSPGPLLPPGLTTEISRGGMAALWMFPPIANRAVLRLGNSPVRDVLSPANEQTSNFARQRIGFGFYKIGKMVWEEVANRGIELI